MHFGTYEVYRRRGRGWELIYPSIFARDSLTIARRISNERHLRKVGVRPSDSRDKIVVYKFPKGGYHGKPALDR